MSQMVASAASVAVVTGIVVGVVVVNTVAGGISDEVVAVDAAIENTFVVTVASAGAMGGAVDGAAAGEELNTLSTDCVIVVGDVVIETPTDGAVVIGAASVVGVIVDGDADVAVIVLAVTAVDGVDDSQVSAGSTSVFLRLAAPFSSPETRRLSWDCGLAI